MVFQIFSSNSMVNQRFINEGNNFRDVTVAGNPLVTGRGIPARNHRRDQYGCNAQTMICATTYSGMVNLFYDTLGDVAAAPIPNALWIFGAGLIGLIGIAKKN